MPCIPQFGDTPVVIQRAAEKLEGFLAKASDDYATLRRRVFKSIRIGSRICRLKGVRTAAGSDFTFEPDAEARLDAFKNHGFNSVVLSDQLGITGNNTWMFRTEDEIKAAIELARSREMGIILSIHANSYGEGYRPAPGDPPTPPEDHIGQDMTPAKVKERIALWAKYDEGDILGVYLLGDDNFLVQVDNDTQIAWRKAVREVTTSIPVLGMIGEHAVKASEVEESVYFSRLAFDHLLVLTYPYNLGHLVDGAIDPATGLPINGDLDSTSPNAELDLQIYLEGYFSALNERYFKKLYRDQHVIPVVQAFNYAGEPAGKLVTARLIETQALTTAAELAKHLDEPEMRAVTYFHYGIENSVPLGLGDSTFSDKLIGVKSANRQLAEQGACQAHESCLLARYILRVR